MEITENHKTITKKGACIYARVSARSVSPLGLLKMIFCDWWLEYSKDYFLQTGKILQRCVGVTVF